MKSPRMALCVVAMLSTAACETQTMPFELAGATVGAALGGYAGAHFGAGLGQVAYIAGGTILGGLAGFEAGRFLKESDWVLYNGAAEKALADGSTVTWDNPETGISGAFRPSTTFTAENGLTCRQFRSTVAFSDAIESGDGTACYQKDGRWQIVSNHFS